LPKRSSDLLKNQTAFRFNYKYFASTVSSIILIRIIQGSRFLREQK